MDIRIYKGVEKKIKHFFYKKYKQSRAAYVEKVIFGWKAGMLTWSPMDVERAYDENLNGYQIHGGNLIYGFIKQGNDRIVEMNGNRASMLDLAMLPSSEVEKHRLEGLYIWYIESDKACILE